MDDRLQLILLIVLGANVVALVLFAGLLRSIVQKLEERGNRDKIAADRLESTLDRMERATEVVAKNLKDAVQRADDTNGGDGAAADAAIRSALDGN